LSFKVSVPAASFNVSAACTGCPMRTAWMREEPASNASSSAWSSGPPLKTVLACFFASGPASV
jgi:hypothetical protein